MRTITFYWLERTAMAAEERRIKRARVGIVDDPLA